MHVQSPAPPRRHFTVSRVLLLLFLVMIGIGFWYVARSGMIPPLAKLVGADKPLDLGVTSSPEQAAAVIGRLGIAMENGLAATNPDDYRKVYSGRVAIDDDFTESELSALLNYNHVDYWLVKDAQVKIHDDGTLEAALTVKLGQLNISPGEMPSGIMRYLPEVLPDELPVYVKGRLDAAGPQQVRTEIAALQVGRVPVPAAVATGEAQSQLNQYLNDRLRSIPGLSIETISFADGRAHFKGTWPQEFRRVRR